MEQEKFDNAKAIQYKIESCKRINQIIEIGEVKKAKVGLVPPFNLLRFIISIGGDASIRIDDEKLTEQLVQLVKEHMCKKQIELQKEFEAL